MKVLYNCTAHQLTDEQVEAFGEVRSLKNLHPALYERLVQTPSDDARVAVLAEALYDFVSFYDSPESFFLFPIGSPALQAAFWTLVGRDGLPGNIIFSHTIREVVENPETGVKTSKFRHTKYIEMAEIKKYLDLSTGVKVRRHEE